VLWRIGDVTLTSVRVKAEAGSGHSWSQPPGCGWDEVDLSGFLGEKD